MIKKVYKEGHEARQEVFSGIEWAAKKVIMTQGPCGGNAILGRAYSLAELSNDGKTIAEDLYHDDEIKQLGVERVKVVAQSTFDKGGDNTTTAVNLFQAFTKTGIDMLNPNEFTGTSKSTHQIKNDIYQAALEICEAIEPEPVETLEDMVKVAFAATENIEHAKMIANLFNVIGKDGKVTYEESYDDSVWSEIKEGLVIEAGFSSEKMSNSDDKTYMKDEPKVLVTNKSIDFKNQIYPVTQLLYKNGIQDLIIVADSFSKEVLQSFLESKLSNTFNIIAIKAPFFGKTEHMKDIAIALGAKFFDKESTNSFDNINIEDFGTAKKVVITESETAFLNPNGNVTSRVEEIKKELKTKKSKFDQEQLNKRLARLIGGVGVIYVGSESPTHTEYLKKKLLNGSNSVKSALNGGAIKGGGLTLIEVSDKLPNNILSKAIRSPYEQIYKNAGGMLDSSEEVLDAASNIKAAIMVAAREAGDVVTIEFANADKYEKPKDYKDLD